MTLGLRFLPAGVYIWIKGISDHYSIHCLDLTEPQVKQLSRNSIAFLPNLFSFEIYQHLSTSFLFSKNGRTSHRNQTTQNTCFRTFTLLAYPNILPLLRSPELWLLTEWGLESSGPYSQSARTPPTSNLSLPNTLSNNCIEQLLSIAQG